MANTADNEEVNVLLVDDQPAKLLTYEEVLKDLDARLVKATSAQEAFQFLLHNDVAVILIDVYMPELDGFQLASMIRDHPRFEKTAIIFISAIYLSEIDRLRGYQSGAVDYVPVPVVPEILRAKVNVFVELYRKTRALERMNRELEDRVAARTAELASSANRLQESEERLRLASEAAEFGTYDCNPRKDTFHCSPQAKELLGFEGDGELSVEDFLHLIHETDRGSVRRLMFTKHADDDRHRIEFRVSHNDGTRWLLGCGRAFFEADGLDKPIRVMGTLLDLTERKQVEERQLLLMAELDHRVKNILANVGAIVKLSSKNTTTVRDFVEALDARIQAIAKAHSVLRRDSWIGINLQTYLSELLAPFIAARGNNIILQGGPIDLSPRAAQSLALVFHELATNALKYGALSVPDGRVTLTWKKLEGNAGIVKLIWREENGPEPKKSGRRGFGTMVINTVAAELGSIVAYEFRPQGVVFSIEGEIEKISKAQTALSEMPAPRPANGMNDSPARQLRILLLEDELLVGLHAKSELESAGHKVIALATNISQGMHLAQELEFDFALLDIRLGDEISVPVAEKLHDRKMNFAFVTGFEDELVLPAHLRSVHRFSKPYEINVILDYIAALPEAAARRVTSKSATNKKVACG